MPSSAPTSSPSHTSRPSLSPTNFNSGTLPGTGIIKIVDHRHTKSTSQGQITFKIVLPFMYAQSVGGNGFGDVILTDPTVGINSIALGSKATGTIAIDHGRTVSPAISIDRSGRSVSNDQDISGDGINDLIVGYPYGDVVYVLFGPLYDSGFTIYTKMRNIMMGWSVAGAGDVNGDGIGDLIFGAPLADNGVLVDAGMSIVLYGKTSEFADLDVDSMTGPQGFRIYGEAANDCSGLSVSSGGWSFFMWLYRDLKSLISQVT